MKKYLLTFLHRGAIFGGLGPIICGIVFMFIDMSDTELMLSGSDILIAIVSTYLLAFIQAGASVFNQIEDWQLAKSTLVHFSLLFITYSTVYILNSWIPFEPLILLIFFVLFAAIYFVTWLTVCLCVKAHTKKLNARLEESR